MIAPTVPEADICPDSLGGVFHSQAVLEHASGAGGAIVTDPQVVGGGVKLILVSLAREHQQDVLCNKVL